MCKYGALAYCVTGRMVGLQPLGRSQERDCGYRSNKNTHTCCGQAVYLTPWALAGNLKSHCGLNVESGSDRMVPGMPLTWRIRDRSWDLLGLTWLEIQLAVRQLAQVHATVPPPFKHLGAGGYT
jgi:hypothetical protein